MLKIYKKFIKIEALILHQNKWSFRTAEDLSKSMALKISQKII